MMELINNYALLASQVVLTLVLFWVAALFIKLDKKLNALKKGTDGVQQSMFDLNQAVDRANDVVALLKSSTNEANQELVTRIEDAKLASEKLRFATTAAQALSAQVTMPKPAPRPVESAQIRSRLSDLDDLPPVDFERRNKWGGLR